MTPSSEGWFWTRPVSTDGKPEAWREIVHVGRRGAGLYVSRAGVGGALPLQDFAAFEFKGPLAEEEM